MAQLNTSDKKTFNTAAAAILRLLHTMKDQTGTFIVVERRDLELLLACWQYREEKRHGQDQ